MVFRLNMPILLGHNIWRDSSWLTFSSLEMTWIDSNGQNNLLGCIDKKYFVVK